jgi:DNA replication and repair protein RecF
MRIDYLEVIRYRNYRVQTIEPVEGLNIFVGENAQGKSNLLESMYVLATTKSTRAAKDSELIEFGATSANIRAKVTRIKDIDLKIELDISLTEKKAAKLNGSRHTRMADVVGQVNAVLFDSGDLETICGEPAVRRRFLDLEISQTSPRYVHALAAYRKTLEQRNFLLKEIRERRAAPGSLETLRAWDQQLANYGAQLIERRRSFLSRLNVLAAQLHSLLSEGRDELEIRYLPSFPIDGLTDVSAIRDAFINQLALVSYDEKARGMTLVGPQRDDIVFNVSERDSKIFGSQGQQRTVALSVKLAERQLIEELVGEAPILLLDDVLSDLDDLRRRHLFETIASTDSQTFVTCTNLRSFPESILKNARVWTVNHGVATVTSD